MQKLILFDIDYTLFDMAVYRQHLFPHILQLIDKEQEEKAMALLEEVYHTHRKRAGHFNMEIMLEDLAAALDIDIPIHDVYHEILAQEMAYEGSLFEETKETLHTLSTIPNLKMGIFSAGRTEHQSQKITSIREFFHDEHIHIFTVKEDYIDRIFPAYKNYQLYFIDDAYPILYKAKQANPEIVTIWSKRGKYAENAKMIPGFVPDYTVSHLSEILPIIGKVER